VVLFAVITSAPANPVRTDHARAELVASVPSVAPGDTFWVALKLTPDEGWHVYWFNPGDAGLPPRLEWTLPKGWQAGPLQVPWPDRFETPPLASYGYKDEVWYPVRIIVPSGEDGKVSGALFETAAVIRAHATWLICREECLPEEADLELTITFDTGLSRPDATHTPHPPS
jgi:thiol:disulfide interchange protein DsbD